MRRSFKFAIVFLLSTLAFKAAAYGNYGEDMNSPTETSMDNILLTVEILDLVDTSLTEDQDAYLEQNGFVPVSTELYASRETTQRAGGELHLAKAHSFTGMASFYGNDVGNKTASGQRFNENAMTAAHRTLPFGTKLRVTYGRKSVVVLVNDRGPFIKGRVLDLSKGAATEIGLRTKGVGRVVAEIL